MDYAFIVADTALDMAHSWQAGRFCIVFLETFGGCEMSSLTSPQPRSRALQRIMHTLRVSPLRGALQDVVLDAVSK